ncbi:hypothetical protein ACFL59_06295 [Planctomycetota bacterium]
MLGTLVRIAQVAFLVVATAALAWFLWGKLDWEPRRELDPFRRTLAEQAVSEVVYELPRRDEIRKLLVTPIVRDVDHRVFDMLFDAVAESELYFVADDDLVLDYIAEERDGQEPGTIAEAVEVGRVLREQDNAIEGVLFSTLPKFSDGRRGLGAEVKLDSWLVHLESGATVPGGVVSSTAEVASRASLDYLAPYMETVSPLFRIFVFLLAAAGLPFALFPIVKEVLRRRDTKINIALICGLTVLNVVFALALMGFRPGLGGVLFVLLGGAAGFVYNHDICEKIEQAA